MRSAAAWFSSAAIAARNGVVILEETAQSI